MTLSYWYLSTSQTMIILFVKTTVPGHSLYIICFPRIMVVTYVKVQTFIPFA